MATSEDLAAAVSDLESLTDDLAKWFIGLGNSLKKLKDAEAQRSQAIAAGGAKSAANLKGGLSTLATTLESFVSTEVDAAVPRSGSFTQAFGGGAGERHTKTVSGQTWVTASTVVYVVNGSVIPAVGPLLDLEKFQGFHIPANNVPGASFDVICYNAGAPVANNYPFLWFSFG